MEEQQFEKNIQEAFKMLNRDKMKAMMNKLEENISFEETTFEQNLKEAGKRVERDRLKDMLQDVENESKTVRLKTTGNWWKYGVAACLIIGLGFIVIIQQKNTEPTLAVKEPKKDLPKNKEKEVITQPNKNEVKGNENNSGIKNKAIETDLIIKSENLGFGTQKNSIKVKIINNESAGAVYSFNNNILTITTPKSIEVSSVIEVDDLIYIKIRNNYYLIENMATNKPLEIINDNFLIQKLQKIE